jgi:hypothetical protein
MYAWKAYRLRNTAIQLIIIAALVFTHLYQLLSLPTCVAEEMASQFGELLTFQALINLAIPFIAGLCNQAGKMDYI